MKQLIFFLVLIFSINSFSQEKICFKSQKEAKSHIIGYWKEKDVATNIIYSFVINDNKVLVEILENLDYIKNAKNELIFNSDEKIKIIELDNCFYAGFEFIKRLQRVFFEFQFKSKNEFEFNGKLFERVKI